MIDTEQIDWPEPYPQVMHPESLVLLVAMALDEGHPEDEMDAARDVLDALAAVGALR